MRILYVDIDTLRPDHLGCYGYHRDTSPTIDALAADGTRFTGVYASDVPCLPSRTALITGRFGIHTGVNNHGGRAADLATFAFEGAANREMMSQLSFNTWAARFYWAGYRTASFSSFPLRHSASWWTMGFQEMINAAHGFGIERADEMVPSVLGWLDRHGREDDWFCHVHLWDPHTPYNTPAAYGNPFADDPIPSWYTEEERARMWELPGPHSAQEPWGFTPDEWGPPPPRQPWDLADMAAVKQMFDGYDVGVRYADDHVGHLVDRLAELGVLDETLIMVASDHGEALGELGVHADHQGADEATAHIPMVLRGPGIPTMVEGGLHYHVDVAATLVDLVGLPASPYWDGLSFWPNLRDGRASGREHLVVTQGAWSCQRGVRFGDHLYLRTYHDGFHDWPDTMLFNVVEDPHELVDLRGTQPSTLAEGRRRLDDWYDDQIKDAPGLVDPIQVILAEGGPYHLRGHLGAYLDRLRATGRAVWAERLAQSHPASIR
jgi:arylsulfatase A-like enzyme